MTGALPAGTPAPDFALPSSPREQLALGALRGHPVVLAFYPADWSPVCGDLMARYDVILEEVRERVASLLGISVDGAWCHQAFAVARRLRFPLLADVEPKGAVSRRYGVLDEALGTSRRALFVIDGAGVIRWSHVSPDDVNPGADGFLRALDTLARHTADSRTPA